MAGMCTDWEGLECPRVAELYGVRTRGEPEKTPLWYTQYSQEVAQPAENITEDAVPSNQPGFSLWVSSGIFLAGL